ncbi:unnamed protein product [Ectocarpus sp. 4 AP-2014]
MARSRKAVRFAVDRKFNRWEVRERNHTFRETQETQRNALESTRNMRVKPMQLWKPWNAEYQGSFVVKWPNFRQVFEILYNPNPG